MALEFFFYYGTREEARQYDDSIESLVPEGVLFKTQIFEDPPGDGLPEQWLYKVTLLEPISDEARSALDLKFAEIPGYDGWGMPTYIPGKWEKVYTE